MNKPASLHLIPVGLADAPPQAWLPPEVQQCAAELDFYIAENARSARAFLKQIGCTRPIQSIEIQTLGPKTQDQDIRQWLNLAIQGRPIGLVSEAGCPAVADPGARVVTLAHEMNLKVVPHVGPSSILLGLMASGLQGQRFAFHGYAPVQAAARAQQLRTWESLSRRQQQTQILIETPYRNTALFDSLLQNLSGHTRLCVARGLTGPGEWIKTQSVAAWKAGPRPALEKTPCLFLFLA